jgi:ABC-type glycerol-3-phosphate transport system permease component
VVLPNSLSPIFAVGILQFLWTWNALLLPMLFLRNNVPLPVLLARISGSYEINWDLRSVAAIITTIVPLLVFLVFQRQFAAGSQTRAGAKE